MKRHVKASSAGSNSGQGNSLPATGGAFATRGVSGDADGSGAPAARGRFALLALAIAAFALLALAPFAQAKVVVSGFGSSGNFGGQFSVPGGASTNNPSGIAVNNSGAGGVPAGTTYVVDSEQHRIQRFSSSGAFERTWGSNVLGRDERQRLTVSNATGGTYKLIYNGNPTGNLAFNITATQLRTALAALPGIGTGNVGVLGNLSDGYVIRFQGALSGTDVSQLVPDGSSLTGPPTKFPTPIVTTLENGFGGNNIGSEICTVAASCQDGLLTPATTANGGGFAGPQGIAVNQTSGHVYVTESNNRRVSEFDADGNFVRTWGWDVQTGGVTTFEVCTVAASCKTAAAAGTDPGRFSGSLGYPAIDSAGNVWVPDQNNNRIQVFSATGTFLKLLGGDVVTDGAQGTGNLTNGSTAVSALTTSQKFFEVGQTLQVVSGIQAGTTITACTPNCLTATGLTLSKAANVTVAGQTLTAAAGAANVPANEVQTLSTAGGTGASKFRLIFNGQGTGAAGAGNFTAASNTVTGVTTSSGAFAVGQLVDAGEAVPAGTTITATGPGTITLSKVASGGVNGQAITAYDIDFGSSAAAIQSKLEGLSNIGAGNVAVSGPAGGPWAVEFKGSRFADTDVPQMTSASFGGGTITITSANGFEVCAVSAECRPAAAGTAPGQFSPSPALASPALASPADLAFDSTGNLYALDPGGRRVQQFNPALTSVANFGAAALAPFTAAAPEHLAAAQGGTRLQFSVANTSTLERSIIELDTGGALKDTSLQGAGLDNIGGLAANDATGAVYATTRSSTSPRRVLVLNGALPDPVLVMNPIATKTDTTANLSGTVDPQGGLVSCTFQYSTDQASWTDVAAPGCDSLSPSGGAQAVSVSATGLIPAQHYFVRLSVSRPLVAGSIKASASQAFDTDGVSPVVTNVGAVAVSDTSARIVATIDPRNTATQYVIEYGTSPSLGLTTAPVAIGSGSTPQVVSQEISGLIPSTTYHFRVVATNTSGPTPSATETLTTRAEPLPLPDDRAYEMVSPVEKSGGGALSGLHLSAVAEDGDAVHFWTNSLFGDPPGVQTFAAASYVSWRTEDGWQTKAATPPVCRSAFNDPKAGNHAVSQSLMTSPNLDKAMLTMPESDSCALPPLSPAAPRPSTNLYRTELFPDALTYSLLNPAAAFSQSYSTLGGRPLAYSHDFSHLVYSSTGNQTADSPAAGDFAKLYEWDNGTLGLVSKSPAGTPFPTASGVPFDGSIFGYLKPKAPNAVSDDGHRIFFQNPVQGTGLNCEANCELYLRQDGTVTRDVSQSECTSACGSSSAKDEFLAASTNGEKAFFSSEAKLTDDDPSTLGYNLYLFTNGPDPVGESDNLTLVSKDEEPGDRLNPDFTTMLGSSDDGDTAYFVANGQVVSGASTAPGPKLYRWRWNGGSPTVDYLVTLQVNDKVNWESSLAQGTPDHPDNRVTPDGKYLLITTALGLDPVADSDASRDLYRWDEEGGWTCVTCQAPGAPSSGDATSPYTNDDDAQHVTISDDGSRVFFLTPDALVSQDSNGTVQDVYEWHDGTISLISSGTASADASLVGFSRDGEDVFFDTAQRLVGWDGDSVGDIYDARAGGGFPEPPATGANCEGEACRSASSSAPQGAGAASAVFEGPGDKSQPASCPKGSRKVTVANQVICKKKKARKHHHKAKKHRGGKRAGAERGAGK